MEQNVQRIGIVNWLALLLVGVVAGILARYANTAAGTVGVVFLALGFLAAAVSFFQMRLEDRERLEKLEFEELKKAKGASTLFAGELDSFTARRSREQFEKFFVPAFTVLLFLLQGGAAWWFWNWAADKTTPPSVERTTISMALYALFALILFLLGKYSAGLARLDGQRLLRPAAGYLMLGALVCFIVALTEAAAWFGFSTADFHVARGFCVVLALAAVETLVGLVFEIYRPRVKGREARLLYESRLIGLLGQPGGLITTAAQALDYQFGFKVSETWFYRFLEEKLAWIVLLQLAVLFGSTLFVIIDPNEEALLERFGRPVEGRSVLGPGWHWKLPWPIDRIYRYPTREIQRFIVGVVGDPELEKAKAVLWTRPHYREEFNMLVASREPASRSDAPTAEKAVAANLLTVSIPVQYRITNLVAWAYNHTDAGKLLEELANREVVRYLINADFENIMSSSRLDAAEDLRRRIQTRANESELGVEVVFVGLQDIHPPVGNRNMPLAASFEEVVGSIQRKETNILSALAYEAEKIPQAHAEATNILTQARSDQMTKTAVAQAEADQFGNRIAAYQASPSIYLQRSYLEALVKAIGPARKYVLAVTNTEDIVTLNLEEAIREDLLRGLVLPPDAIRPPATPK